MEICIVETSREALRRGQCANKGSVKRQADQAKEFTTRSRFSCQAAPETASLKLPQPPGSAWRGNRMRGTGCGTSGTFQFVPVLSVQNHWVRSEVEQVEQKKGRFPGSGCRYSV